MSRGGKLIKTTKSAIEQKARKVLISFVSLDQDSWDAKCNDVSFMQSFRKGPTDTTLPKDRHEIWRPSVALAQLTNLEDKTYAPLRFDDYYLLWDGNDKHKDLPLQVKADIEAAAEHPSVHLENLNIKKAFDTKFVYQTLFLYLQKPEFQDPKTEYYVNCTSGTTAMRNCLFLLTQIGHINAVRISPTPWVNHRQRGKPKDPENGYLQDGRRSITGSYTLEDPKEFGKAYAEIGATEQKTTSGILSKNFTLTDTSLIEKIARVVDAIRSIPDKACRRKQSILITGETGVGKTQLAQNMRDAFSPKTGAQLPFFSLNCATIRGADPNIQRIELFGAVGKVANVEAKDGALKMADGGVLFLDEVGELSLEMQAMLLTALDSGEFTPFGDSTKTIKSSFQLVCGTNRPMDELVESGQFRRDLYNRINMWHFSIPPLRERRGDIELNVTPKYIHEVIGKACGINNLTFNEDAKKTFLDFAHDETITWDGNFRELNAMLNRMAILSDKMSITPEIVEEEIARAKERYADKAARAKSVSQAPTAEFPNDKIPIVTQILPSASQPGNTNPRRAELLGEGGYEKLPLLERAEFDLIVKTVENDRLSTQKELAKKIYGKFTPGQLGRYLEKKFRIRFAHGKLSRIED
ncbi:MAG: RNA repair transcriptional activator RtcR family protein [bacterium]|nr:RNA repair transcriptional activator RtcR family protein [bacterium]